MYHEFRDTGDLEGGCAAIGAAINKIWDSGNGFSRFALWHERIDQALKQHSISILARTHLYASKGTAEIIGSGDLPSARKSFELGLFLAKQKQSLSLRFFHTVGIAYICIHTWELSGLERCLSTLRPLAMLEEIPLASNCLYRMTLCIHLVFQKRHHEGVKIMEEIETRPYFEMLPHSVWLETYTVHLLALSAMGDSARAERIAQIIQARAVPMENHLEHSAAHRYTGIAVLLKNPYKALLHASEAEKKEVDFAKALL